MPIKLTIKNDYKLNEHAYIFASLVYGFVIVEFFKYEPISIFIQDSLLSTNLFNLKPSLIGLFFFATGIFSLFFLVESWWGSKKEQEYLGNFSSYIFFLIHPLSLYFFNITVFKSENLNAPNISQNAAFEIIIIMALILGELIVVRTYFSFHANHILEELTKSSNKIKSVCQFILKEHTSKLCGMVFALLAALAIILAWEQFMSKIILPLLILFLFVMSLVLRAQIKRNAKKFNKLDYEAFIEYLIDYYLPITIRDKKCYGFLLFNRKKVPRSIINWIITQIRDDDLYNTDDNQICCCLLTSTKNMKDFERRIKDLVHKVNAKSYLMDNHITFQYKEYKKTNFAYEYYKLEFVQIFNKAYGSLNI